MRVCHKLRNKEFSPQEKSFGSFCGSFLAQGGDMPFLGQASACISHDISHDIAFATCMLVLGE